MAGKRAIGGEEEGTTEADAKDVTGGGAIPAAAGGRAGTWPLTPWGGGATGGTLDGGGSGSEGAARAGEPVPWSPRRNSGITASCAAIA